MSDKSIIRRIFNIYIICVCANAVASSLLIPFKKIPVLITLIMCLILLICYAVLLCSPMKSNRPTKRLSSMEKGCELLISFLFATPFIVIVQVLAAIRYCHLIFPWEGVESGKILLAWGINLILAFVIPFLVLGVGALRIYLQSIQLGIKQRVLCLVFSWIPILNIIYLLKVIRIVQMEVKTESHKILLNAARADYKICKTKYPVLLVHGVFFRDFKYFNYWGRIPRELINNGATIYYGKQQSAASVEECGKEIAERIREIVEESGCEKVNIIAHSKGGLDSRAAITHFGSAPYVASLTTINTPHRGCLFADYLLSKAPEKLKTVVSGTYNAALKQIGDTDPNFMEAVTDLTSALCEVYNANTQDSDSVFYQSVMSYCRKARSGTFPLNISYPLVKHFDGRNDGLVSVESAKWGEKFTLVEPHGRKGISHADMIDLNQENIPGFDVLEFYVSLLADLKARGF